MINKLLIITLPMQTKPLKVELRANTLVCPRRSHGRLATSQDIALYGAKWICALLHRVGCALGFIMDVNHTRHEVAHVL